MNSAVDLEVKGDVATVTLTRTDRKNTLDIVAARMLERILRGLADRKSVV